MTTPVFEVDGETYSKLVLYWGHETEDGCVPYIEDADGTRRRAGGSRWGEPYEAAQAAREAAERRVAAYAARGIRATSMSMYEASCRAEWNDVTTR